MTPRPLTNPHFMGRRPKPISALFIRKALTRQRLKALGEMIPPQAPSIVTH